MFRGTKKVESTNASMMKDSSMISHESTQQTLEREVDNCTRVLEQEKRKYFRIQENYQQVRKELDNKNKELKAVKSKQFQTEVSLIKGELKNHESTLADAINSFNQVLSKNNRLKNDINELRKEKKSQIEVFKSLKDQVVQLTAHNQEDTERIVKKKQHIGIAKKQILNLKEENCGNMNYFRQQIAIINKTVGESSHRDKSPKSCITAKTQTVDTQPVVKLRLKNMYNANKEKIKVVGMYTKNMEHIYSIFEEIKQETGIKDMDELTSTFLKQEEENRFILQFVNKLHQDLEEITEVNTELRDKIQRQRKANQDNRHILTGTPQEQKRKMQLAKYAEAKNESILELEGFVESTQKDINEILASYDSDFEEVGISARNLEQHLALIEEVINREYDSADKDLCKRENTRHGRLPPVVGIEELRDKQDDRLMDQARLKEYAVDYLERKKAKL